jgi:hypothetical protein
LHEFQLGIREDGEVQAPEGLRAYSRRRRHPIQDEQLHFLHSVSLEDDTHQLLRQPRIARPLKRHLPHTLPYVRIPAARSRTVMSGEPDTQVTEPR